jgi:hypothetical protein
VKLKCKKKEPPTKLQATSSKVVVEQKTEEEKEAQKYEFIYPRFNLMKGGRSLIHV